MKVSFVIPAYRAAETVGDTLASVHAATLPSGWSRECIVIDDGSPDGKATAAQIDAMPETTLFRMPENRGKSAAVNVGLRHCTGDIVIQLDADDTLVDDWPSVLARILQDWPEDCVICFSACRDQLGKSTVERPHYTGPLSYEDVIGEKYFGEYLPMFRRAILPTTDVYKEVHPRCACEWFAYLNLARLAPLWISAEVIRVYHTGRRTSITAVGMRADTAEGVLKCYDAVLERFGDEIYRLAPRQYRRRRLRQSVFAALAGDRRAFGLWRLGASWRAPVESVGALLFIVFGRVLTEPVVRMAKRLGLLRRFG